MLVVQVLVEQIDVVHFLVEMLVVHVHVLFPMLDQVDAIHRVVLVGDLVLYA